MMKRLLGLLFCLLLLLSSCTVQPPASDEAKDVEPPTAETVVPGDESFRYESDGFDSPEAAVLYFLDGLKNLNFEQMLDAYAWETRISRFSAEEYLRYISTFTSGTAWLPGSEDIIRQLNLETMRAEEANILYRSILLNFLPEEQRKKDYYYDQGARDTYLTQFDRKKLESLREITRIRFLTAKDVAGDYLTERRRESLEKKAAAFGIDEIAIIPAIAEVGDKKLFMAPTVARYGDRWFIYSTDSLVMKQIQKNSSYQTMAFNIVDELPFSDLLARDAEEKDWKEASSRKIRYEGDGFRTPEEAVTSYLEGLKKLDLNQMLRAFAWETMAAHYASEEAIRFGGLEAYLRVMPMVHPFLIQAETHALRAEQIYNIYGSLEYYLLPDDFYQKNNRDKKSYMVGRLKEEEQDELIQHFSDTESKRLDNLARLAHIRFISIEDITGKSLQDEEIRRLVEHYTALYGADEIRFIVAIGDIDDQHLFVAPIVVRYGDKWYMAGTSSNQAISYIENASFDFRMFGRGFAYGSIFPLQ